MNLLKFLLTALMSVLAVTSSGAAMTPHQRWVLREQLLDSLVHVDNADDSIKLLYDIYDLCTRSIKGRVGEILLETASNARKYDIVGNTIIQLSERYSDSDSMQYEFLKRASKMPYSQNKRQVVAFVCMMRNSLQSRQASEFERQRCLKSTITKLTSSPPTEKFDKIVVLHSVCAYLAQSYREEIMNKYYEELVDMVEALPKDCFAIKKFVYAQGCQFYAWAGCYDKAIKYHEKFFAQIDSIEQSYHDAGRIYRDYSVERYERCTSMLLCYPELKQKDVDAYYLKSIFYAENDSDVMMMYRNFEQPKIYYMMAKKRYDEVVPVLKRQIDKNPDGLRLRYYLKFMIDAAGAIGDKDNLLEASLKYNSILDDFIQNRDFEKYRELQILYDVYELKSDNDNLELEKKISQLNSKNKAIIVGVVSLIILLIFLFIVYRLYRSAKRLTVNLATVNESLKAERDNLQKMQKELIVARDEAVRASKLKSDFINNISNDIRMPLNAIVEYSKLIVDCVEGGNKPYLERFANLIEFNGELLTTIVNDVLHLSELDNSTITLSFSGVRINQVCHLAVDTVMGRVASGVKIVLEPNEENLTISSDRRRIEQVLVNLLSNAVKFTESGSITLSYKEDLAENKVIFSVTDTGCGVPPEKKDVIFDRFVKLNKQSPGAGLGLTISKRLAQLLGGDVWLDTTYKKGARFKFSVPINS